MADAFLGEIRAFAFNYAPRGWMMCLGQRVPIQQYTALYAVIGDHFGPSDRQSYFTLPDMSGGRAPVATGSLPGQRPYDLGAVDGQDRVTLTQHNLPPHTHAVSLAKPNKDLSSLAAKQPDAASIPLAYEDSGGRGRDPSAYYLYSTSAASTTMTDASCGVAGQGGAHANRQPYLPLNFCICVDGYWPPRP